MANATRRLLLTRPWAAVVTAVALVTLVAAIAAPSIGASSRPSTTRKRNSGSLTTTRTTSTSTTTSTTTTTTTTPTTTTTAAPETTSAASAETTSAPLPVASLHVTYVDSARGRTIPVTVYYPAATGSFPLVVFAHGYAVSAATYAELEEDIAAAGFVVAAPDFPLSSSVVTSDPVRDPVEQAADVSFVISSLLDSGTRPPELEATIANDVVGVIGHSDGGITAAGVAYNSVYADSRVGAAVILSGAAAFFPGDWFTTASPPLLAIHGSADEVNPFGSSQALFDGATGQKWLVTVADGSHAGPFTTDAVVPSVAQLVGDFLHANLNGDAVAAARIASDAGVAPLTLTARG